MDTLTVLAIVFVYVTFVTLLGWSFGTILKNRNRKDDSMSVNPKSDLELASAYVNNIILDLTIQGFLSKDEKHRHVLASWIYVMDEMLISYSLQQREPLND
jgi:hypothetical protein